MADTIKTIAVELTLNSKDFKTGIKEADALSEKAGKNIGANLDAGAKKGSDGMSKLEESAKRTGDALLRVTAVISAAATAAVGFALKSAASFQQTRIGIENMLGSADAARDTLQEISDIAKETPFEFSELADSAKQLLAFGFNAEDAISTMRNLGDVSAAVGTPMGDLTYLMGTLKTQGRAFTIDIRQFAQRGIPIYEYLAKVLDTDTKSLSGLIEEGKVGFPEVEQAFKLMTSEGGKFYGTMDKQSQSLNGRISTLKDNIAIFARKLVGLSETGDVVKGGLFDKISNGISELNIWIDNNQETIQKWSEDFTKFVTDAFNTVAGFVTWVAANKDWLLPMIGGLVAFKAAMDLTGAISLATKAFSGFATILSAPITLNIVVAGALMALAAVALKAKEAMDAVNNLHTALGEKQTQTESIRQAYENAKAAGNTDLANKYNKIYQQAVSSDTALLKQASEITPWTGFLTGINQIFGTKLGESANSGWANGGFTGSGSANEVAGLVHKGEYVLPQNMVNQSTGMPELGSSIENHIGTINISSDVDGEKWLQRLTQNQEIISKGLVPTQRYA